MKWTRSDGSKVELDTMSNYHLPGAIKKHVVYLYWQTVLDIVNGKKLVFFSDNAPCVLHRDKLYCAMTVQFKLQAQNNQWLDLMDFVSGIIKYGLPLNEDNSKIIVRVAKERRLKAIRSEARKLRKELK